MNIFLPNQLEEFVEEQISSERYSSVNEYVRELIRSDEKRKAEEHLEALLIEGLQGSEPTPMTGEDWEDNTPGSGEGASAAQIPAVGVMGRVRRIYVELRCLH